MVDRNEIIKQCLKRRLYIRLLLVGIFILLYGLLSVYELLAVDKDTIFFKIFHIFLAFMMTLSFIPVCLILLNIKEDIKKMLPKRRNLPYEIYNGTNKVYENISTSIYNENFVMKDRIITSDEEISFFTKDNFHILLFKSFEYNIEKFTKYGKFINKEIRGTENIYLSLFGNKGYEYNNNSAFATVNSIVILVVTHVNDETLALLKGAKETFVVLAVVDLSYKQILIANDNRWIPGDDYLQAKQLLLKILDLNTRSTNSDENTKIEKCTEELKNIEYYIDELKNLDIKD